MAKFFIIASCIVATFATVTSTNAIQEQNMPLSFALDIAQKAVQACAGNQHSVTAAVVGRDGILRALLRADNAPLHSADAARRKAYTSASSRLKTSAIVNNIRQNPDAAQLVAINDFLILGGGVPIEAGGETIGAIGVAGAPGGHLDEACAITALEQGADEL